jgi:hypothetical protein
LRNALDNEDGPAGLGVEGGDDADAGAAPAGGAQPVTLNTDSLTDRNYAASSAAQRSDTSRAAAVAAAKRAQGTGQPPPVTEDLLARFFAVRTEANLDRLTDPKFLRDLDFFETYEKYESLNNTFTAQQQERAAALRKSPGVETLRAVSDLRRILGWYPQLIDMGWVQSPDAAAPEARPASSRCLIRDAKPKVRVIDIVPRQSALTVNDTHATQKGFALAAKFLTLFGFGGQVSYQRQRSVYEQFINQDVFAAGFGKGTDRFGWTMGPVPGTKRLAPGPRTTFAILAVPSHAWQINLQAKAVAFPHTKSPTNPDDARFWKPLSTRPGRLDSFDLFVPNENTEGFWADSINYTPVRKGERVTAVIGGRYFSPLTGVMVDGVPLKRAVAIAKHESDSTTLPLAADSPGEYEYLNPNQIIVSFKTASTDFVGTPLITLVTPEKTAAINFFRDMRINFRFTDSLQHHSLVEPMFMDDFTLTSLEVDKQYFDPAVAPGTDIPVRITGAGFRRRAEICLSGGADRDCALDPPLVNTGLIELTLKKPAGRVWTITYRLGQKVASKDFDTVIDGAKADAPTIDSIENPSTNNAQGLTTGGYTVIIRGKNLQGVSKVSFGSQDVTGNKIKQRHPNVLIVEVPKGEEGGVQVMLEAPAAYGAQNAQPLSNILDFLTPGKAIFKYVAPPKTATPAAGGKGSKKKKGTGKAT